MTLPRLLLAAAACAATAACAAGSDPADAATPPGGAARALLSTVEDAVRAARADAARRLGVSAAALDLVSVDRITWADGSLGCPQPGVMYTMALVPGYRVQLRVNGAVLDYHASQRGALLLCPAGQSRNPAGGTTR
jgi:hypothetical protein